MKTRVTSCSIYYFISIITIFVLPIFATAEVVKEKHCDAIQKALNKLPPEEVRPVKALNLATSNVTD